MNEKDVLSKEEAEEILLLHLGSSSWLRGNFNSLARQRAKPLDTEKIHQSGQISVEDLRRYLGLKKLGQFNLDTHLGQISWYAWLKGSDPIGGGFSPIFDAVAKVKEKYPPEKERLGSISRRIAYLSFLRDEMEYMNKRYDYEEIPIIFEFYTNKVEVYTTLLVDLLLIIGQLWCDRPGSKTRPGPRPERFEKVFDCFNPLDQDRTLFFDSINFMLHLSAAIAVRHIYVHGIGPKIILTNEGGVIEFEIPLRQRYGEFERYMADLYNRLEKKPPAGGTESAKDMRFPEFEFVIRGAKKGGFNFEGSIVRYKAPVSQYVRMLEEVLGMIIKAVLAAILN